MRFSYPDWVHHLFLENSADLLYFHSGSCRIMLADLPFPNATPAVLHIYLQMDFALGGAALHNNKKCRSEQDKSPETAGLTRQPAEIS